MRDALRSWKFVVLVSVICICATVVVVIWIELPRPQYRYERIKDPSNGIEHIYQIDEQTGQSSMVK